MPELKRILNELPQLEKFKPIKQKDKLSVTIKSFSYKKGIPIDSSGNGGGFVFDCRFINNPGRIEKYKNFNGKDKEIIEFLESDNEVNIFKDSIIQMVNSSINNYISRDFKYLSLYFGCTGGQHRSVYFAEQIANYIKNNFDVYVELQHTEGF